MLLPLASGVEAGPRQVPHRTHTRHTVWLVGGRRNGAAHGFDFHDTKGRPFSRRAIFSRSSSFSPLTLATTDFKRRFSSSSIWDSRLFRLPSPPARKRSRPFDESGCGDAVFPRGGLQVGAAQEFQGDGNLAPG